MEPIQPIQETMAIKPAPSLEEPSSTMTKAQKASFWSVVNLKEAVKFVMQQVKNEQAHAKQASEKLKKSEIGKS